MSAATQARWVLRPHTTVAASAGHRHAIRAGVPGECLKVQWVAFWSIAASARTRGRDAAGGIVVTRLALWFSLLGEVGSGCSRPSQTQGGDACAARRVRLVAAESRRHG